MRVVNTYTPDDVKLVVSGYQISGIKNIAVSWNDEPFKMIRGRKGINTRVQSLDTSGTISVEVLQTSVANDIFSGLLQGDQRNQSARLSITLKDSSGRTLIESQEAFVSAFPEFSFSDSFDNRTWSIIMLSTSERVVGGNSRPAQAVLENLRNIFNT